MIATIEKLYAGLRAGDGDAMASCYADGARFNDPAFGELDADQVRGMWRMLCERSGGVDVELSEQQSDAKTGSARWVARYTFADTGKDVVNDIRATYRFDDAGLIVEHDDVFDLRKWADQALGKPVSLLGYTPLLKLMINRKTGSQLKEYLGRY